MAIGKYSLMFELMILIGIVYKTTGLHCPAYTKYQAILDGLLSDRALCRTKYLSIDEKICLNGLMANNFPRFYCATGACNIFGYNCDGHCLSGDDHIDRETDYYSECDASWEIKRLCNLDSFFYYDIDKPERLCSNFTLS